MERYRTAIVIIAALAGVALLSVFVFFQSSQPAYACSTIWTPEPTASPSPGATENLGYVQPDMGNSHVARGDKVTYTYCAPASGSHVNLPGVAGPIAARVYGPTDAVVPMGWIHNLEHGGLVILYKTDSAGATPEGQAKFKAFYEAFPPAQNCGPVIAPFDKMSTPFQAILWGRVLPLETFDDARVTAFWEQWGGRSNPEKGGCPTPNQSTAPTVSAAPSTEPAPRRAVRGTERRPDRRAERGRALPELIEATAVRLVSYFGPDDAGSGIVVGDRVIPLVEYAGFDVDPDALDDLRRRASALTGAEGLAIDDLELVTPVIAPGKIVCVGLNYREHASEGGRPLPTKPLLFSKFANALVADGQPIVRPEGTHALDLEVELGVVIGTTAHRVSRADALDHVAGYVVVNDVSARDWQGIPAALAEGETGDGQWLRAKGSDTFLPMSSVLVTADEIPDPQNLRVRSWRTPGSGPDAGTEILMQDATTADMIWGVAELIEYISRSVTLDPGDVIATGTPSGVGVFRDPPVYLEPGDRVRCEIDGIGSVENPVIDWLEDIDDADVVEPVGDFELDDLIGRP